MCTTCGCGTDSSHHHHHGHEDDVVKLEKAILETNDQYAEQNRDVLAKGNNIALNFVSSPGSGKTSLLERTIKELGSSHPIAVVEGDQHTDLDAERIRKAGAKAYQINTGKACHLDAHMVGHAFEHLGDIKDGFVMIENVGNLICPAMFDLGEKHRVAVISTTEGADKPLKYPDMFYYADVVVINKIDLSPYVDFDIQECIANIKKIRSDVKIFELSVKTGAGFDIWLDWLRGLK
ncbi:hydrogenase accessory protein HypB [Francisella halioticida]|uniref:Hydrogenase maturation factor HypB n=1 Tax=Francisella halioticida TaxID=549298 RepID=A0ABM6LWK3_9GAMM|nr:hydrogenase nickel incorporation protein HypB [Francisella halioticida]ASG67013.1 hydrogenase accessory protein HypB [Francisella halioticida]BCD92344.1 hydrogenase accessory protein HypB [Francisella halioticida]